MDDKLKAQIGKALTFGRIYYKLNGKEIVPVDDLYEWGSWFQAANRQVARTVFYAYRKKRVYKILVSTAFLGIDHAWINGTAPILFETMVFGGPHDNAQHRCATWGEAETMHESTLDYVLADMRHHYQIIHV